MSHTEGKIGLQYAYPNCLLSGERIMASAAYEADARRLVACWNAMEPYPTELLEKDVETMYWDRSYITKQRDELLKALRRQFNADKALLEMPDECPQVRHEEALEEHNAAHKAIELILAKYPEAS